MTKVYGVTFKDSNKAYNFLGDKDYQIDDLVIVDTEKGLQYAKIIRILEKDKAMDDIKSIVRLANNEDKEKFMDNLRDAEKALKKCREIVVDLGLEMQIINAQYTLERNQLLFNFVADSRIDFRELAKKLASIYHTRIELRQVGARDKAKEIGGVGICGRELCCSKFLRQMDAISMNMAKDQNLALNPSKINGACGRLLCCLAYENENYLESSKGMPSLGEKIKTEHGEGVVTSIDVLNRCCKIMIDGEKENYYVNENSKK
jgi:cell fate regulator YaaT (PSP1 superfamily)